MVKYDLLTYDNNKYNYAFVSGSGSGSGTVNLLIDIFIFNRDYSRSKLNVRRRCIYLLSILLSYGLPLTLDYSFDDDYWRSHLEINRDLLFMNDFVIEQINRDNRDKIRIMLFCRKLRDMINSLEFLSIASINRHGVDASRLPSHFELHSDIVKDNWNILVSPQSEIEKELKSIKDRLGIN